MGKNVLEWRRSRHKMFLRLSRVQNVSASLVFRSRCLQITSALLVCRCLVQHLELIYPNSDFSYVVNYEDSADALPNELETLTTTPRSAMGEIGNDNYSGTSGTDQSRIIFGGFSQPPRQKIYNHCCGAQGAASAAPCAYGSSGLTSVRRRTRRSTRGIGPNDNKMVLVTFQRRRTHAAFGGVRQTLLSCARDCAHDPG